MAKKNQLTRALGFWSLFTYGVGDILGAGIYALLGKVVDIGKGDSWIGFSIALGVALLTACSYAELSSRHPKSGGAASFCHAAFKAPYFSTLIGWMVLWSGMVSMATISQAFSLQLGAWNPFFSFEITTAIFLAILAFINFWGIKFTSVANALCTCIELSGLFIVIYASISFIVNYGSVMPAALKPGIEWPSIFLASGMAFYAFIGFEDLVNIAEEVKQPEKTLPRALISSILFAGLLYVLIAYLAVQVISPDDLGASPAPMLDIVSRSLPLFPLPLFAIISLFAMANTALLNFVMGSRLIYGMSDESLLPAFLGKVHKKRKTPYLAIVIIFSIVTPLAIFFNLIHLAATTSALILAIFFVVHLSLIKIKRKQGSHASLHKGFQIPLAIPILGLCFTLFLMAQLPLESLLSAVAIILVGALIIGVYRSNRP